MCSRKKATVRTYSIVARKPIFVEFYVAGTLNVKRKICVREVIPIQGLQLQDVQDTV